MLPYLQHHLLAAFYATDAALHLLSTQPETDVILEIASLLDDQFDILQDLIENRHHGSDALDITIRTCQKTIERVDEFTNTQEK